MEQAAVADKDSQPRMRAAAQLALVSAQIAGDLFRASQTAKQLLLVAQNSRVLASRVQSEAPGLSVLASFFAEVSNKTILLADEVNKVASTIAGNSVEQWRLMRFSDAVSLAMEKAGLQSAPQGLAQKQQSADQRSAELARLYNATMRNLNNNLGELVQQMQASQVLAVNFHLESTRAKAMESSLRSMVNELEAKSQDIGEAAQAAIERIKQLRTNRAVNQAV